MQSHAGLFNLCIVVLVAVNSRLIIENLMKVWDPFFLIKKKKIEKAKTCHFVNGVSCFIFKL